MQKSQITVRITPIIFKVYDCAMEFKDLNMCLTLGEKSEKLKSWTWICVEEFYF